MESTLGKRLAEVVTRAVNNALAPIAPRNAQRSDPSEEDQHIHSGSSRTGDNMATMQAFQHVDPSSVKPRFSVPHRCDTPRRQEPPDDRRQQPPVESASAPLESDIMLCGADLLHSIFHTVQETDSLSPKEMELYSKQVKAAQDKEVESFVTHDVYKEVSEKSIPGGTKQ